MGAKVRWKSENESDNKFAYAYYSNYAIAIIFVALSAYNLFSQKYLSAIPTVIAFFVCVFLKNLYADFSANSKCKNPHSLQEFLAAINLEKTSKIKKFMRNMSSEDYAGSMGVLFMILLFCIFPVIASYEYPYYFNFVLTVIISLFLLTVLFLVNAKILDRIRISNEKVTHEIMKKVESVVFQRPEDKVKFSDAILERLKYGYITRLELYEITTKYVFENDRTDMVAFLKNLKSNEEKR